MSVLSADHLAAYAAVLLWAMRTSRAVPFRNGELVLLRYDLAAAPLADAAYAALIEAHLHPLPLSLPTAAMQSQHFGNSSYGQLTFAQPGLDELYRAAAGIITILAPEDLEALSAIDVRSIAQGEKSATSAAHVLQNRRRVGLIGSTVGIYPTPALAEASGMTLAEYAERLARACLLLTPDPVVEWRRVKKQLADIAAWLDGLRISRLRMESEHADLTLSPGAKRRFVGFTGRNVPGYEIYVPPDWRSVEGVYYADQPSIRWGRLVAGARLEFRGGVAIDVAAEHGGEFLAGRLSADGGARRVGEFSLTDRRISRVERFMAHTLLDENFGGDTGNCHIALGGAPAAGFTGPAEELTPAREAELGFNSSILHWDIVNTEPKRVTADLAEGGRRVIYESGRFLL